MGLNAHEIIRRAFLDACREHGLDPCVLLPEIREDAIVERERLLLAWIGAREVTAKDVAESLGVKASSAHQLLRIMEARGLVEFLCEKQPYRVKATGRSPDEPLPKRSRYERTALEACWG